MRHRLKVSFNLCVSVSLSLKISLILPLWIPITRSCVKRFRFSIYIAASRQQQLCTVYSSNTYHSCLSRPIQKSELRMKSFLKPFIAVWKLSRKDEEEKIKHELSFWKKPLGYAKWKLFYLHCRTNRDTLLDASCNQWENITDVI